MRRSRRGRADVDRAAPTARPARRRGRRHQAHADRVDPQRHGRVDDTLHGLRALLEAAEPLALWLLQPLRRAGRALRGLPPAHRRRAARAVLDLRPRRARDVPQPLLGRLARRRRLLQRALVPLLLAPHHARDVGPLDPAHPRALALPRLADEPVRGVDRRAGAGGRGRRADVSVGLWALAVCARPCRLAVDHVYMLVTMLEPCRPARRARDRPARSVPISLSDARGPARDSER